MSEKNVEVVRRIFDSWGRGDFSAAVGEFDPHVLFVLSPDFPDSGTYLGPEEVARYTRDHLLASWSEFTIEAEELIEAGDSVAVHLLQRGVGLGSGLATEFRYYMVWTFRGSSIIRLESLRTRDEALEAVGLRE